MASVVEEGSRPPLARLWAARDRGQHDHREWKEVNGVTTFLERRAAIRREQRHAERVREQSERGHAERAPSADPCDDEPGENRERQHPLRPPEPDDPLLEEAPRAQEPRQRGGLAEAAEPADEPAFHLRRRRRRIRHARGPEAEEHHGDHCRPGQAREDERAPPPERAREGEERDEQERLRAREDRERRPGGAPDETVAGVRDEGCGHEERRERDLHPRQGAPRDRARPEKADGRQEGDARRRAERRRRAPREERRYERGSYAQRLGRRERRAEHRGARREEERPEGRRRTRDRPAGVVGKAGALREVAGEVEVDPRVVERKADGARDLPLADDEEEERGQRGESYEEIIALWHGGGATRGRTCSPRTRRARGRAAARRGSGRGGARSP